LAFKVGSPDETRNKADYTQRKTDCFVSHQAGDADARRNKDQRKRAGLGILCRAVISVTLGQLR
jgi:hypothetical protein